MVRSGDGKTRTDSGNTSVIADPKAQQVTVLDHLTKEAHIMPMQPAPPSPPQLPQKPGMPPTGAAPPPFQPPAMHVQDLGKSVIDGHEVDGKRYIIQPPAPPPPPQAPQVPGGPPPAPPKPPAAQKPTTADLWTSTKLGLPVMSQVTGPFGKQTSYHKIAETMEPHPAMFQIPPGYKQVMPPAPPLPK
jgi:hypothetical protein